MIRKSQVLVELDRRHMTACTRFLSSDLALMPRRRMAGGTGMSNPPLYVKQANVAGDT